MDPIQTNHSRRIHPLMATAAGAVIVACGVGVAAMTGILPHANGTAEPAAPVVAKTPGVTLAGNTPAGVTPAPVAATGSNPNFAPSPTPAPQYAQSAPPPSVAAVPSAPPPVVCHSCGVVTSVAAYKTEGHGTGIGAVGGAVAGGLLGHAFGGGNGRIATTLLGAAGGGYAGNTVERHLRSTTSYRVNVRLQDGSYHSFNYSSVPPVHQGERIHIERGVLRAG